MAKDIFLKLAFYFVVAILCASILFGVVGYDWKSLKFRSANAAIPEITLTDFSGNPVLANNRIFYVENATSSPLTFTVQTGPGIQFYHSAIDYLPPGITIDPISPEKFQVTVLDVRLSAGDGPVSYGITFVANSTINVPSGEISEANVILVIEPSGDQRPHPTITLDDSTYSRRQLVNITVTDPHTDCLVQEQGGALIAANDPLNVANIPSVRMSGSGFASDVVLVKDDFNTNEFRGQALIPEGAGKGMFSVAYSANNGVARGCVWPQVTESAIAESSITMSSLRFGRDAYTASDTTGENTDVISVSIQDSAATTAPTVNLKLVNGANEAILADKNMPLDVLSPGLQEYELRQNIASIFDPILLAGSLKVVATYSSPDGDIAIANTTILPDRKLSVLFPNGDPVHYTNDTITFQLIDPASNLNSEEFEEKSIAICAYKASDGNIITNGKSIIRLLETERNSGVFVTGYHLSFIDALSDVPLDNVSQDSHVKLLMNEPSQLTVKLGSECALPADTMDDLSVTFTINPSVSVLSDSGRGESAGALPHHDPPFATASLISCSLYGGDTDGDGLCDNWETSSGLKIWYPSGSPNYYLFTYANDPYPNYRHKDVFVEYDYVDNSAYTGCTDAGNTWKPDANAITNVKAAFNSAPVSNPDGTNGIKLHVYAGDKVNTSCWNSVSVWNDDAYPVKSFDAIKRDWFGKDTTERPVNSQVKGQAKWNAFHYCLFIPKQTQDPTSSGVAEQLGNDCVVSLGVGGYFDNSVDEQQGTFMHEIGHNLGLYHGGPNAAGNDYNVNCKPIYPSVMSYMRQTTNPYSNATLRYSDDTMDTNDNGNSGVLLNSPQMYRYDPDETGAGGTGLVKLSSSSALSSTEVVWGINGAVSPTKDITKSWAKIDWNNNGILVNTDSNTNILNTGVTGCGSDTDDHIYGADDWANLQYNFRELNPTTFATGFRVVEPDTGIIREIRAQGINTTNHMIQALDDDSNFKPINSTGCSNPHISADDTLYEIGDPISVIVADGDANHDKDDIDHPNIRAYSNTDPNGLIFVLDETGDDTGIFEKQFVTKSGNSTSTKLSVSNGDNVTIEYSDECSAETPLARKFTISVGIAHHVVPVMTKESIGSSVKRLFNETLVGSGDSILKLVSNQTGLTSERASLEEAIDQLKTLRLQLDGGAGGNKTDDQFANTQNVTEARSFIDNNIASLEVALNKPYGGNGFNATSLDLDCDVDLPGCTITGESDTATATVDTFNIDNTKKVIILDVIGQGNLTLQIPENLDPSKNTTTIYNVFSEKTGHPYEFAGNNASQVILRDLYYYPRNIMIFYGPDVVSPSPPVAMDAQGNPLNSIDVNQQIILSTTLDNYLQTPQPFVALIEVRNSDDQTVHLAWQTGTLNPNGQVEVGLSWTPTSQGNFTARVYVISSLQDLQILSAVHTSSITVG